MKRSVENYGKFTVQLKWDDSPACSYCGMHCTGEWVLFIPVHKERIGIALPSGSLELERWVDAMPAFCRDAWEGKGFDDAAANPHGTEYQLDDLRWALLHKKARSIDDSELKLHVQEFLQFCLHHGHDTFIAYVD